MKKKVRSDYSLVIIILCFELFFLYVGLGGMPKNLYIVPVTESFGFSRGEFSLVISISQILGLFVQLLYGRLQERFGVKTLVTIGVLLMPASYLIFSSASTLWIFYAGAILFGIGMPLSTITSASILINNWINEERQGLVLGFISAGSGFGGSLFSLVVGNRIISHGFKSSYTMTAIILALGAIPIIFFLRSKPGEEKLSRNRNRLSDETSSQSIQRAIKELPKIKKPAYFWFALISIFLIGVTVGPTNANVPGVIIEKGFDEALVAKIVSATFLFQALIKILLGYLNDHLGIRFCIYFGLGAYVLGTTLLILSKTVMMLWTYVIFAGISITTFAILVPLFVRSLLDRESYSKYIGLFMAVSSGGMSLGNPLINFMYDLSGTYTIILSILTIVGLSGLIFAQISLKKNFEYKSQAICSQPRLEMNS